MEALKKSIGFSAFWAIFSLWLTLRMLEAADLWPSAIYHITPLLGVWVVLGAFALYHCWPEIEKRASAKQIFGTLLFIFCATLPVLSGVLGLSIRAAQIGFTVDL
ncbi:TPA: hypothetical protein DDW35_01495 [Candidatus Sumerlaeota bacterium]|nr:hypothetical protein [Candidatus Sumerlaeota bacterium]